MKGKAKGHGKESKEQFDIVYKLIKSTSLNAFVRKPIAKEEDDGTNDKETGNFKDPRQMSVCIFNVEHGNAQKRYQEDA